MSGYRWRFFRAGGVDQVQLRTGADLVNIGELDQKLWVALACPVNGTEFDKRTLELIDGDGDKRVRAGELIAAVKWTRSVLNDVEILARQGDAVPLTTIDASGDGGKKLLATSKRLLANLGKADATELSFGDLTAGIAKFDKEKFNGDGVITVATANDAATAGVVSDIVACTAVAPIDRSGDPGVTRATLAAFFDAVAAHVGWLDAGNRDEARPLGAGTDAAFAAFESVRSKIDDYFSRVKVATYDTRALEAINREQAEYLAIAAKDLHISSEEVRHFPLARVAGDQPLPLEKGLNPAWAEQIAAFRELVVKPLVGPGATLAVDQWSKICNAFDVHTSWRGAKAGAEVEKLGAARLAELSKPELRAAVEVLLGEDEAMTPLADAIKDVERLVRYRRDLMSLANNFVSFRDFYARSAQAMFQVGRLYIDRRSCDLCLAVGDAGKHGTMASHSNFYLLYCDLRNARGETRSIAAAVTDGDVDNLMVGRNGIFYDREGNDWDATITKIVENPISVRQAFWSPYKKLLRLIEDMMNKRAAAADANANAKVEGAAAKTEQATGGVVEKPPEGPKKLDIGVVAAIGVAVGGITAAFGALLQAFFGLGIWMPLGILGLLMAISGPSMAIAWLKLRKRNLGPLLDANGWALGSMARVNIKLGASLTDLAALPKGADRDMADPFADKKRPWWLYTLLMVIVVLGVLWFVGKLDGCLPEGVKSTKVLGKDAPAAIIEEKSAPPPAAPAEGEPAPAPAP